MSAFPVDWGGLQGSYKCWCHKYLSFWEHVVSVTLLNTTPIVLHKYRKIQINMTIMTN